MNKLPIIIAPMFLISTPEMVIEAGRAGVIGSLPLLNARPAEKCAEWLEQIREEIPDKPWAVNFICHRKANKRFDEDLQLIKTYKPPIVITSLGNPSQVVKIVHEYGGLVYSDVATAYHARKAADAGVDGLILVCAGAGGHGGTLNPFAFIAAVKEFYEGTIILAGSISTGADIAAAKIMGADYAYMGTRFLAADESNAVEGYKQMVIDSTIEDIIYTDSFSGIHANFLIPSLIKEGINPKELKTREDIDLSHIADVKAWRDLWSAGQGVTTIKKQQSTKEIIQLLKEEYEKSILNLKEHVY